MIARRSSVADRITTARVLTMSISTAVPADPSERDRSVLICGSDSPRSLISEVPCDAIPAGAAAAAWLATAAWRTPVIGSIRCALIVRVAR